MKAKSNLKQVNKRVRLTVDEAGTLNRESVPMYLDSTGEPQFIFKVPDYVKAALSVNDVSSSRAAEAETKYDELMRRYSDHMKLAVAEPVIVIFCQYRGRDEDDRYIKGYRDFFDNDKLAVKAGLRHALAFRVNGKIHHRVEKHEGFELVGHAPGYVMHDASDDGVVVLDYTPERHSQVEALEAAINRAALALHALSNSETPHLMLGEMAKRMLPAPTTEEGKAQ